MRDDGTIYGNARTIVFVIWSSDRVTPLGQVKWFGRWRCYAFFPNADTVFETTCLEDLSAFCYGETRAHMARAKERRRANHA